MVKCEIMTYFVYMNWQKFIIKLLDKDFRFSDLDAERETGIPYQNFSRWRKGEIGKPQKNTIRRLEKGLGITIDDSDPENITYTRNIKEGKIPEGHKPNAIEGSYDIYEFPVLATVSAGPTELADAVIHGEKMMAPYLSKGHRCFAVNVDGTSMDSTIPDGSVALVDMDYPLVDNCIAAVKLVNGKQFIKRYRDLNYEFISLYSDNKEFEPFIVSKKDVISAYRVVWTGQKHI